ncbi:ABC transporter permease [Rhizobium leguminosarum]|uniref:ABC transporter permease n=1 Tax=Rhizobium leguminosarum TaxID=384 RepID=UPI001C914AE0|nr:ABC transporter permease [Rhizobium leguminosarum]MBY2919475.1 ABC transporter permease [Rhizobium leguminosarum]MBY2975082.1 ABC transporter permease [Rhizobium leguminosarum]MBY2981815.1 ABC transporter permease [Rhizobium leguminosarum]MBY3011030.1 ABC transporter permease [Rhizobium leguminosarum]
MMAKGRLRPGFTLVFRREFDRFSRRRLLLSLTTILPLLLMGLLALVFSAGLATRLPIAVLDLDGTDLSRTIIRTVDATPDTAVASRVSDLAEGRQLILSGQVRGLLMLPRNLERDVYGGRRPEVVFFYNTQAMTSGNLVLHGINSAVPAVAAGIRLSLRTSEGQPLEAAQAALAPIPVQVNPLFNPTLNYAHFLLAALLPSVLQVIIVTTMAYAVGLDVETSHRLRVLRRLGGGLWPAMAGKILPYTLLFLVVLGIADWILFGVLDMPLRGNRYLLILAGVLFILADQFIGVLLALLLRPMASAISIGTLLMAPAFGFMGIGFPRIGMNAFAYNWGQMIPGTWYLMARIDQTIRGTPLYLSWRPIAVLLFMVLLLGGLTALRLEVIRARRQPRTIQPTTVEGAPQ